MATVGRGRGLLRAANKHKLGLLTVTGLVLLALAFVGVLSYLRPNVEGEPLRFDVFQQLVLDGAILDAEILDEDAYVVGRYVADGTTSEPRRYNAPLVRGTQGQLLQLLVDNEVPTEIDQQAGKRIASLGAIVLPGLILVVLFVYLIVSFRRGTGLFGLRSNARKLAGGESTARFADVAGQDAAVAELQEISEFLSDPQRYAALGAQVPKGVLLYGPPGCGKTLLARALAGESGASFYTISGSDFVELYAGVGAGRVRELFREARENAPAVVFIDELDSVGRARGSNGAASSRGEQEQALNQILTEMDGFATSAGLLVVAATNRPDVLDQALLRPGRFDRTVGLERPDEAARLATLELHAQNTPLAGDVDLTAVASKAIGLTGADLAGVVNEAALLAARAHAPTVGQTHLDEALTRILEAPERQRRLSLRDRSVAKRSSAAERVTFAEVAGVDDAVTELAEVRDYLADPERFAAMGARVPRGILLYGPPGCGKTLLARAVAGEANAAFFSVAASEFVEVYVGEGASRVRELFAEARAIAPAIVFIDEIDAIGGRRHASGHEGNRETEQTLNQILVELDGFQARTGVIVMAATNRPDVLDPALVRPGRFDRQVGVTLPDRKGRRAMLALHTAGTSLAGDVDLDTVATLTQGFTGADLANVVNEAALLAARQHRADITMALLEEGIDRARLGVASRGVLLSEDERRLAAYHEAGHALVARALPSTAVPHKVSIIPRGTTLGHCQVYEAHGRAVPTQSALLDEMAGLLGGRVAEELVLGDRAAGSAGDLQRVADIARRMVCEYAMSDALGPLGYSDGHTPSPEEAHLIHLEVRGLADQARQRAASLLETSREALDRVAAALLDQDTVSAEELDTLAGPVPTWPTKPLAAATRR